MENHIQQYNKIMKIDICMWYSLICMIIYCLQVADENKLSVFINSKLEDGCPQMMLDAFIRMGINGLTISIKEVTQCLIMYRNYLLICCFIGFSRCF